MSGSRRRNRRSRRAHIAAIFRLQNGVCYLCPDRMRQAAATCDHVTPRSRQRGFVGKILMTHRRCNERKADRSPHPCELIYLEAINLRLKGEDARFEARQ